MKNLKKISFALLIFSIFSCSETTVTRQESGELESANAPAIGGLFKKRVLIEDYTGTWCGNCAVVSYAIEKVYENPNNASVTVAIHSGNDPYKFLDVAPLHAYIFPSGTVALPEARLNRNIVWKDQDTNLLDPINLRSNNCGLGLAIQSKLIDSNISF